MSDGLLWSIILVIVVVVVVLAGIAIAECKYDDCINAGFTEAQCRHELIWNN